MAWGLARRFWRVALTGAFVALSIGSASGQGDPAAGVRAYTRQCVPCHSLDLGRHMTGPSLFGIIGRKAGSAEGFDRYSPALAASAIVWSETTLSQWLANPQAVVPGNTMTALVADEKARADIVAYLAATQTAGAAPRADIPKPHEKILDLKSLGPASRIASIAYCRDTYTLKMENGATLKFWERNLRFKTDGSNEGPSKAKPVLVPSGMHGDRYYAVFAAPEEISASIARGC